LAVNLAGLALLVAVGAVAAWYRQRGEPAGGGKAAARAAHLPVPAPSSTTTA
jgi:hypothetical protein